VAQRDRFIRRLTLDRVAFVIRGDNGAHAVVSPRQPGRHTVLLWSSRAAADRWAPVLDAGAIVDAVSAGQLLADLLPDLATQQRLAGPDWTTDPLEPEVEPADLADRLRAELLRTFWSVTRERRVIHLIESDAGPARITEAGGADAPLLPCWSRLDDAETALAGRGQGWRLRVWPLDTFLSSGLPWLAANGWRVVPEYAPGAGMPDFPPDAVRSALTGPAAALDGPG
jgi:hypothetical protein